MKAAQLWQYVCPHGSVCTACWFGANSSRQQTQGTTVKEDTPPLPLSLSVMFRLISRTLSLVLPRPSNRLADRSSFKADDRGRNLGWSRVGRTWLRYLSYWEKPRLLDLLRGVSVRVAGMTVEWRDVCEVRPVAVVPSELVDAVRPCC